MPDEPVDARSFRQLMGRWATGVAVVTAHENGTDYGLTVNALLSISLDPPLLLASLTHDADTTPVIERTGRFAVHLLAHDQRPVSERFASTATPRAKFEGLSVHRGSLGLARPEGVLASLDCRVEQVFPVADHRLIVGRVVALEAAPDRAPLLFFRSRYGELDGPDRLRLAPPRSPGPPEPF